MFIAILQGAIVLTGSYVAWFYYKWFTQKPKTKAPIPLPFGFGHLHLLLSNDLAELADKIYASYGGFVPIDCGFGTTTCFVTDANIIREIYHSNKFLIRIPDKDGLPYLNMKEKGLLYNRNMTIWKKYRSFFNQAIGGDEFLRDSFTRSGFHLKDMMKRIDSLPKGQKLHLEKWISSLTTDLMILSSCGEDMHCVETYAASVSPENSLNQTNEKVSDYVAGLKEFFDALLFFVSYPRFMLDTVLISQTRHYKNILQKLTEAELSFVERKRHEIASRGEDKSTERKDFLTMLITSHVDGEKLTDEEIISNLREMHAGGTDTTTNSVLFALYNLIKNPLCEDKVLQELKETVGPDNRDLTYEDLPKLKYLENVIRESNRLYPVATLVIRTNTEPVEFNGIVIPKDTQFLLNHHAYNLDSQNFTNPLEFQPERFEQMDVNKFLWFGAGPRICPGRRLALMELKIIIATLIRKFKFSLVRPEEPRRYYSLALHMVNLDVTITPRS
eukprot:TRINITY_DN12505_c0_g1_i1.p1 TRINITY_DN12505_c0_g1~~TRINITY_DN12505_c0_g1_i1.p1  ORF type:complete len:501 (-),score=70.84 TRINITY_DN12505_c0_g1_i1:64-1566(-)